MIKLSCVVAATMGLTAMVLPARAADAPAKPPNILWISTEDISPDLRYYGDEYAITPNLDRFAAQGVRFNAAFSTAPVCAPSRCSIITGMYASSVGGHHMRSDVVPPSFVKCFPEYLRAKGYFCTNNAKTDYNFPAPVTAWDECNNQAHWRHRPDKSQPFFAVFNIMTTHEGHVMNKDGQHTHLLDSLSPSERHDPAKAKLPSYYPDTPKVRAEWARYYDTITLMDKQFAAFLKQLDDDGLAENTIVCFWGDHGRCLPRGKRWPYDSGLRVPLLVRWPGHLEPGSVRDDLVTVMDLAPTSLSVAGITPPSYMQARVIFGPSKSPDPQYVFATRDRMDETFDMMRGARDERFRYIKNFHPELPYAQIVKYGEVAPIMQEWRRLNAEHKLVGPQALFFAPTKSPEELYDEKSDPDEVHNLAADPQYAGDLQRMRIAVEKWMTDIHDLGVIPEDQLKKRMRPTGKKDITAEPQLAMNGNTIAATCPTEGSSIAYTTESGNRRTTHWHLYIRPVEMQKNLRFKAVRLGYEDSAEISVPRK